MFSKFFIERPIFATVISLIIVLAGLVSMKVLPVEQYPNIVPTEIQVTATYPGRRRSAGGHGSGAAGAGNQRRQEHDLHVFQRDVVGVSDARRGV